uniref:CCHC-type domain-containing protein n=1 Tax=Strigamia maritima TaxID=126957 RepID=T1IK75_STRMM
MGNHQQPKPLVPAERLFFTKRAQLPTESIAQYVIALKTLSKTCNFGAFLNERLCDQMVGGLLSEPIQRALVTEAELTFDDAYKKSIAMELAAKLVPRFHAPSQTIAALETSVITRVGTNRPRNDGHRNRQSKTKLTNAAKDSCSVCGSKNHSKPDCYFTDPVCHGCGKVGHIRPVCRSSGQHPNPKVQTVDAVDELCFYSLDFPNCSFSASNPHCSKNNKNSCFPNCSFSASNLHCPRSNNNNNPVLNYANLSKCLTLTKTVPVRK